MKILINLVGLSHHDVGNHLHSYKPVYNNLFKNLVNPLRETNQVDFFLQTYETPERDEMEKIYNPIHSEYRILRGPKLEAFDTYISSIEKLKDFDYDFYIVTRFDLDIRIPLNVNFKKFNFLFKELELWDSHEGTTDTFYAFPKKMLDGFIQGCKDTRDKCGEPGYFGLFHALHKELTKYIESDKYHFIDEEKQTVQISKKYTLSRYI
jgi:hypothetical protein